MILHQGQAINYEFEHLDPVHNNQQLLNICFIIIPLAFLIICLLPILKLKYC